MTARVAGAFGMQLKALREAAGFTQHELATIAGLSVHAVSALERGERRRPHVETLRALSAALDLTGPTRDAFLASPRLATDNAVEEFSSGGLPLSLTALVGRDDDVRTLQQWLADSTARLITLLGPGGVGKTRLAVDVARAIATGSATRVLFVHLAAVRDPQLAAAAIAETLGLVDISASDLPRRARTACEGRPTFMVLDNVEQVTGVAPLIADLLASATTLRLLVTSRAPLRVRGERQYTLSPLALDAGSDTWSPADLAGVPAVRLFLERVRDVLPDFVLTSDNGPVVAAICRRLDGLPLALELVAPWLKLLTADDVLRRLEDGVLLSTVGRRDLPERQQTMNATVAWSYQLLNPDEQRAFRHLGEACDVGKEHGRFAFHRCQHATVGNHRLDDHRRDEASEEARYRGLIAFGLQLCSQRIACPAHHQRNKGRDDRQQDRLLDPGSKAAEIGVQDDRHDFAG